MKIFISWSGERSEAVAKALRDWLPLVLHFVKPWLSQSDIQAGDRWSIEIARELEISNFGLICITKENISSPWLLFEAGALAKSMEDGKVIPFLLDLDFKEISGPLAQFQAKKAENAGIKNLILSLNAAATDAIPDGQLNTLFDALWPSLETALNAIPRSAAANKQQRSQGEILEELVSSVRGVEMRFRDAFEDGPVRARRRSKRPMALEMIEMTSRGGQDPIALLMIAGHLRDTAPWLSELLTELYRSVENNDDMRVGSMVHQVMRAIEMLPSSTMEEELGFEGRELLFFLRHLLTHRPWKTQPRHITLKPKPKPEPPSPPPPAPTPSAHTPRTPQPPPNISPSAKK